VLVLTGPTGSGKSEWAVNLARSAPVEIVSVDSAQVFRGLDIGTAKPGPELRRELPHHLIDLCNPEESYSAGRFVGDALRCIREVHSRHRVPLLVGGTMLYLRALLTGLAPLPQAAPALRAEIDARAVRLGWPALHAELARLDPVAAGRIRPTDPQRIQRALEVCYTAGAPLSALQAATVSPLVGYSVKYWALAPPDRGALHAHLARRFEGMLAAGFLEEVRTLRMREHLTPRHPSMRAVGYRQLWAHLDGEYDLKEAVLRGISATRQLAKRQLTWMRAERHRGMWLDPRDSQMSWNRDVQRELRSLGFE
jgi:tRNA dimethylallyltransferase